jgi:hypothetical protein
MAVRGVHHERGRLNLNGGGHWIVGNMNGTIGIRELLADFGCLEL